LLFEPVQFDGGYEWRAGENRVSEREAGIDREGVSLANVAASVKPGAVLDGEVVVHRKLRRLIFIVFDVLANLANKPILHLPFEQRLHHPKQASIVEKGVSVDVFDRWRLGEVIITTIDRSVSSQRGSLH